MKKIIFLFCCFFVFLIAPCFASGYYIKNWDVDINVGEDKILNITERIDVFFKTPHHGYFRYIPLEKEIINKDGSTETAKAQIAKIKATALHEIIRSKKDVKIVCGNPDRKVIGAHSYRISYNYKIPFDKTNDEFIFDIIGLNRNDYIKKAHFKITFPKEFDTNKIDFAIGKYGSSNYKDRINYKVYSNMIIGETTKPLAPKEALTLIVQLPMGYFIEKPYLSKFLAFLIITVLSLVSYITWFIYGKDDKVIPVINFYPPEGLTSAEVGTIYNKTATGDREIVSSILYLASCGYINIVNQENDFTIKLIKKYDGKKTVEKKLMEALFKNYTVEQINKKELQKSRTYYKHCTEINTILEGLKDKLYKKSSRTFFVYFIPILAILALIWFLNFICCNFDFSMLSYYPLMFIGAIVLGISGFMIILNRLFSELDKKNIILFTPVLTAIALVTIAVIGVFTNECSECLNNWFVLIYGFFGVIISIICVYQMPKKNKLALKLLGHIEGYRKFLKTAEQKRIEQLMKDNPYYCFDMLPYAYVLGIVEEWTNKFEGMNIKNPDWYIGSFNRHSFGSFTTSMSNFSVPTTSNGGIKASSRGFSGGGRSGGGFGGGGGGAW